MKQIVSRVLFCIDFSCPYCQRAQQLALKKCWTESLFYSWAVFPNFIMILFKNFPFKGNVPLKIIILDQRFKYNFSDFLSDREIDKFAFSVRMFWIQKRSGDSSKTILLWNLIYVEKYKWWRYNVYLCMEGTHFSQLSYPILLFKKNPYWLFFLG